MPHKFNTVHRDKIPKQEHRVTNWREYNEGLRHRGDLTVWISEDALSLWSAERRTTRGGQPRYPDLAIELCLTLGMVFKQPLRQTQGLMRSIAKLLGVEIAVKARVGYAFNQTRQIGLAQHVGEIAFQIFKMHLIIGPNAQKDARLLRLRGRCGRPAVLRLCNLRVRPWQR